MTYAIVENGKMSGMDDIFGEKGEAVEKVEAAQPEPVVEVVEQPQPAPEPKGEAEVAPPAAAPEEPRSIPISAILDEREKRQEAQRRAAEYEAKVREYEEKERAASQKKPDFYENPDEFMRMKEAEIESRNFTRHLNASKFRVSEVHGEANVLKAEGEFYAEAHKNPHLAQQCFAHPDPYAFVMQWYKRNEAMKEIGEDPAAYRERVKAEILAELQAQQPAAPVQQQVSPRLPGSLTQAPSAAKSQHVATATFDSLFSGN